MRRLLAALATGALALGLIAPTASAAAPAPASDGHRKPPVVIPDGETMLRIEAVRAEVTGGHRGGYRVTLSKRQSIDWMGEVSGVTTVGALKPRDLAENWGRMGFGAAKSALTVLTWGKSLKSRQRNLLVAYLADPRITRDGELSFGVSTLFGKLPRRLDALELNVSQRELPVPTPVRVGGAPSATPTWTFPAVAIDPAKTAFGQVSVVDDTSATFSWTAADGYTSPCRQSITVTLPALDADSGGFLCGNGSLGSTWRFNAIVPIWHSEGDYYNIPSMVEFWPSSDSASKVGAAALHTSYTPTGQGTFTTYLLLGIWGPGYTTG